MRNILNDVQTRACTICNERRNTRGVRVWYKQRGGRGDAFFVASRAAGPAIIIMR